MDGLQKRETHYFFFLKIPRLPLFGHFLPRVQTRIFRFIA